MPILQAALVLVSMLVLAGAGLLYAICKGLKKACRCLHRSLDSVLTRVLP